MITELRPNEIFVFGSNLAGIHGAGAALTAKLKFGAQMGIGIGPTGKCYAIPTKDENLNALPLWEINRHVRDFLIFSSGRSDLSFLMTRIGCGLAGYRDWEISPMFNHCPPNVILPEEWR